ncbi:MAG TPA: hypothetical protein VMG13_04255 [Trebonia sp.]|nr:hypothetical protein [Trebonia sp.]
MTATVEASQHSQDESVPRARWLWGAGYAAAAAALFLCYLRVAGTQPVSSDGASNALQAWDMLHGNWLLKGWTLSDVSFYTTELPEYVLVEAFRGLGPADVHVSAALTYTLLVIGAGLLAKGSATGREGLVRVLIATGIMIAPQVGPGTFLLLQSPDHTGTGVPLLLVFLLLDRAPRRWWVPALICLLLAWTEVGDRIAITVGAAPIAVACVVRAYRDIVQRRERAREHWFEPAVAAAALVSAGVAAAAGTVLRELGGFAVAPLNTTSAPSADWPAHLALAAEGVLGLYGADFTSLPLGAATVIALVHLAGVALAAWAAGHAIRRFFCCDLVTQVLTVAIVVNLAVYALSVLPDSYWANREIAPVLPFGAVLAGRVLAGRVIRARLLPALAVVGCCYLGALGYGVTRPQQPAANQALADWLAGHHLTTGLGSYAEGNSVTLDSHGAILLAAPAWFPYGVFPGDHEAKAADFDPRLHDATFFVTTAQDGPAFTIPAARIIRAFGEPAHTYHYQGWTIMTWPTNLLTVIRRA